MAPLLFRKAVNGIAFPATRRDLIDRAHENKAQLDIVALLQKLPSRDYQSLDEVEKEAWRHLS